MIVYPWRDIGRGLASAQWRFENQLGTRSDGRISVATRADIGRFSGACTENASPGLTAKKTVRIAKTVVARVQALRYRGSATRSHRSISASGAFEQFRSPCRGM